MTFPSTGSARSDATTDRDAIHLECQKQDLMKHSLARANGKDDSRPFVRHVNFFLKKPIFSFLSSSLGYRHGMILMTRI
jgi:hypothetical protein